MTEPRRLPEQLRARPFRFADAAKAGIPRSRLRAADLRQHHRGAYIPLELAGGLHGRCLALAPVMGEDQAISHLTAARAWQMPLPFRWSQDEALHVIALGSSAPMRRDGIVGWETESIAIATRTLDGVRVVDPVDVWCQLAVPGATGIDDVGVRHRLSPDWLVAVGDYLLTGPSVEGVRKPLCTREDLERAVLLRRGRRGVRDLRDAIERMRHPVHSPKETFLRLAIIDAGLPEPQVQVPVLTADGWRHADLGYPDRGLLLEYQGDHHRADRAQWLEDLTRVQLFEDAGKRVMLIGAEDVRPRNLPRLIARIRRALRD